MTLASVVSCVRIIFGPPFAFVLILQLLYPVKYPALEWYWSPFTMLILYLAFSLTDLFDGLLAKKFGKTRFGAWLDPFADKVLDWSYSAVFIFTVAWNSVFAFALLFILDVVSTAERTLGYKRADQNVDANWWGKYKKTLHSAAIVAFLITLVFYPESAQNVMKFWSAPTAVLGWLILWLACWFSAQSCWNKLEQWKK